MSDDLTLDQNDEDRVPDQATGIPVLNGFRLETRLGAGTFGEVWSGLQLGSGQQVAVKVLHDRMLDVAPLRREVERLREVSQHPNIVSLLDARLDESPRFLVMPRLQGSLEDHRGASVEQIAEWLVQAAEALSYCHGKGILHCDLKPANFLLDNDGRVNLCDFGQAMRTDEEETTLGSLGYMAPEHLAWALERVGAPDVSWDLYGLGATAYVLLCKRLPRLQVETLSSAGTTRERLELCRRMMAQEPLVPIRKANSKVDRDLAAIVEKCLSLAAADRPSTAAAVLDDLRRRSARQPVHCRRPWSQLYLSKRWVQRNRVFSATIVVLVSAGFLAARAVTNPHLPQSPAQPPLTFEPGLTKSERERLGRFYSNRAPLERDVVFNLKSLYDTRTIPQSALEFRKRADLSCLRQARVGEVKDVPMEEPPWADNTYDAGMWDLCWLCHERRYGEALQRYLDMLFMVRTWFNGEYTFARQAEVIGFWRLVRNRLLRTPSRDLQACLAGLEKLRCYQITPDVMRNFALTPEFDNYVSDGIVTILATDGQGWYNSWLAQLSRRDYDGLRRVTVDVSRVQLAEAAAYLHPTQSAVWEALREPAERFYIQAITAAYWEMRFDGLRFEVAAELYRRKHGKAVTSLEQLVPVYLPEVPLDRISGKPMVFGSDASPSIISRLPWREGRNSRSSDPYYDVGTTMIDPDAVIMEIYVAPDASGSQPLFTDTD